MGGIQILAPIKMMQEIGERKNQMSLTRKKEKKNSFTEKVECVSTAEHLLY